MPFRSPADPNPAVRSGLEHERPPSVVQDALQRPDRRPREERAALHPVHEREEARLGGLPPSGRVCNLNPLH